MKRANLLVPPPSLNGTTHVMVFPDKSTFAYAVDEIEKKATINKAKILCIFSSRCVIEDSQH